MCGLRVTGNGIGGKKDMYGRKESGKESRRITCGFLDIGKRHQMDFTGLKATGNCVRKTLIHLC